MSWQSPSGNWGANGTPEDVLRARLNARSNGGGGQLSLNEQLALQNQLGLGGAGLQTQNYSQSATHVQQQQPYSNQAFSQGLRQQQQQQLSLGLNSAGGAGFQQQQQGLQFPGIAGTGGAAGYGKLNQLQSQSLGFTNPAISGLQGSNNLGSNLPQNFANNPNNSSAVLAALQQQMLNLQQNVLQGGFQNTGQASVISNNLQQAMALAQQQQQAQNLRNAASLANNPTALNAYLYRLQQQQNLAQATGRQSMGLTQQQLATAQYLSQQAALQQANQLQNQLHANPQVSANMAALLKAGNNAGTSLHQQQQQLGESPMLSSMTTNQNNQGLNLAGFNSTGLANSELASAPLLPILGTDLAKPSQKSGTGNPTSEATISSVSAPLVSSTQDPISAQNPTDNTNGLTNGVTGLDSSLKSNPSVISPTAQQAEEARKALSRASLSSPLAPQAGHQQVNILPQGQGPQQGNSPSSNPPKERDLTTLKTLGQMLAKTGNSVESAVQNGLLGGCNAEDVKIVWEAYVMEYASLKQYDSANKAFQKQGAELVAKRAKSDDPFATKLLMEAAKAPTASVPGTLTEALQCLGMDEYSKPPTLNASRPGVGPPAVQQTQPDPKVSVEDEEDEIDWDGIIENEHDYVPHTIIDEVNKSTAEHPMNLPDPREAEFNAMSYGFFAANGHGEGLEGITLEDKDIEDSALEEELEAEDTIRHETVEEKTGEEEEEKNEGLEDNALLQTATVVGLNEHGTSVLSDPVDPATSGGTRELTGTPEEHIESSLNQGVNP